MARHTLSELARIAGAELQGDGAFEVEGTAGLAEANARQIAFLGHPRYLPQLERTAAGAVVVPPGVEVRRDDLHQLVHPDPSAAFTRISGCFAAERWRPRAGVHPSAAVDPSAELAPDVAVGPFCWVGPGARLGPRVVLHAGVHVGAHVVVGEDCELHPGVVLYEGVTLGARCLLHAGCVLGSDGFGFLPPAAPGEPWRKIPHSGTVVVEDDVEVGAGSTVDRGRFGATRLARGVKLDNLVHVAHNVQLGAGTMIAAQAGLAGSARVGEGAQIGGQVGLSGHNQIGAGARIAAQSGVMGDVPPGEEWFGYPARPRRRMLRQLVEQERLGGLFERVKELEARLEELERGARGASASRSGRPEETRP